MIRSKRTAVGLLAVWCGLGLATPAGARAGAPARSAKAPTTTTATAARAGAATGLDAIPLYFEEGSGTGAKFTARGDGYGLALDGDGISFALGHGAGAVPDVVRMRFAGATSPSIAGEGLLPGKVNRLAGTDPSAWREGIRTFSRVRYSDVYPGVDAVCYGTRHDLEYDFVVRPGASPSAIRLAFDGAESVAVAASGELVVKSARGEVRQKPPVAYQETAAGRRAVACAFTARGNEARFALGAYDRALPLVVDPVLAYSTYIGGSSIDEIHAVAVDAAGNIYVTGVTASADFPVRDGDAPAADLSNVFVTKIAASGTELVYSTTLHGQGGGACGYGVAVDAAGNAFVAGTVDGHGFPLRDPLASNPATLAASALLAKLDPSGGLVFSTLLGGGTSDSALGLALDPSGNPVVVGATLSSDFPSVHAVQPNGAGPEKLEAFVAKVSADGREILFSTTLGGTVRDEGNGVAVDAAGAIYAVGMTTSPDFPTTPGSLQWSLPSCDPQPRVPLCTNAFVTKIAPDYSVAYSTYLGGSGGDVALGVAADRDGNAYVTGWTDSPDFPTKNPAQGQLRTIHADAFVTKIAPDGASIVYSTYFGGTNEDNGVAIAVDDAGRAAVAGTAHFSDLTTVNAVQGFLGPALNGTYSFVAMLDPDGSHLSFSSYVGGSVGSAPAGVAFGSDGGLYVAGTTSAPDMPVQSPLAGSAPPTGDGSENSYLIKIDARSNARAPKVDSVKVVRGGAAKSARIVVDGVHFDPAMRVFVGAVPVPAEAVSRKGTTRVVILNPGGVFGTFAPGVTASVRCVNAGGGEFTAYFTPK